MTGNEHRRVVDSPSAGASVNGRAGENERRPAHRTDDLLEQMATLVRRLPENPLTIGQRRAAKVITNELTRRYRHSVQEI